MAVTNFPIIKSLPLLHKQLNSALNPSFASPAVFPSATTDRSLWDRARQFPSFLDWPGVRLDGVNDDTEGMQAALDDMVAAGGGRIILQNFGDTAIASISDTLIIPGMVNIVGAGRGVTNDPTSTPASTIRWDGAPGGTMIKMGWQPDVVAGGGFSDFCIDGNYTADIGISSKDHAFGTWDRLRYTRIAANAQVFTNDPAQAIPTGFHELNDLLFQLRDTTVNANAFYFDGDGVAAGGVTNLDFKKIRAETSNGHLALFGERCDACSWENVFHFRASVETGYAFFLPSTTGASGTGNHKFTGLMALAGGVYFAHPINTYGWQGIGIEDLDQAASYPGIVGPGASGFEITRGTSGRAYGWARSFGPRTASQSDDMHFIRYDSANTELRTNQGNYKTGGVGTPAFATADQPGGAVSLATSAASGDSAYFWPGGDLTNNGQGASFKPQISFVVAPVSTTNFILKIGLFADVAGNNAVWMEYAPSSHATVRCYASKAGVLSAPLETLIPAGLASISQGRIEMTEDGCAFFWRTAGNNTWICAGFIPAADLPIVNLQRLVYLRTLTTAAKTAFIYDLVYCADSEA